MSLVTHYYITLCDGYMWKKRKKKKEKEVTLINHFLIELDKYEFIGYIEWDLLKYGPNKICIKYKYLCIEVVTTLLEIVLCPLRSKNVSKSTESTGEDEILSSSTKLRSVDPLALELVAYVVTT
ncbi:hypothetical protein ACJX0J_005936, partial [Zea mays]